MNSESQDFSPVAEKLLKLVRSEELKKLSYKLDKPNLFELVDLGRQEIKHSKFLIQLLDPNSKIDTGPIVLRELVRSALADISDEQKIINTIDPFQIELESLSDVIVQSEYKNMDIFITSKNLQFVIVIENKVGASESKDQLRKYREIIEKEFADYKRLFIFLTPDGREPETDDKWLSVSYQVINQTIKQFVKQGRGGELTLFLLKHYSDLLEKYVLNQQELEDLANKIYAKHKAAIDLIISTKTDDLGFISDAVDRMVSANKNLSFLNKSRSNKLALRYTTEAMDKLSDFLVGNGWGDRKSMVWGIYLKKNKAVAKLVLGPCERTDLRRSFRDLLKEEVGFSSTSAKWSTIKSFNLVEYTEESDVDEVAEAIVNEFEKKLTKEKDKYEAAILEALRKLEVSSNTVARFEND